MKKTIHIILVLATLLAAGCNYLEPLPNGAYTDENIDLYPEILRKIKRLRAKGEK